MSMLVSVIFGIGIISTINMFVEIFIAVVDKITDAMVEKEKDKLREEQLAMLSKHLPEDDDDIFEYARELRKKYTEKTES